MKKTILISILAALFIIIQGIFLMVYVSVKRTPPANVYSFNASTASADKDNFRQNILKKQDRSMLSTDTSNNSVNNFTDELTIPCKGQLIITSRSLSSLEATLAQRIPEADRMVSLVWEKETERIDVSRFLQASVDNASYKFLLNTYKGHFLNTANSSYVLELQIPSAGGIKPIFKWFLFDASLQYSGRLNLIEEGIKPGKIVSIEDYDSDGADEILFESSDFISQNNYSRPRFMFKILGENMFKVVWREAGTDSDVETGRCAGVAVINYNSNNPPPADDPNLKSIKTAYASRLFSGLPPSATIDKNQFDSRAVLISNCVTCEETKYYPSKKTISSKTLDVYVYSWDINTKEFIFLKKEAFNLDLKIKQ